MRFILGVESITSINDGGLGIRYNAGPGRGIIHWQPDGTRPVLSLEVHLSFFNLIRRPKDNVPRKRMTWSSYTNTPVKYSAKYWVKRAIKNSTKITRWNIKRCFPPLTHSLIIAELRHPRQPLFHHNILRQTTEHVPFRDP
jgi:hypothetical protein